MPIETTLEFLRARCSGAIALCGSRNSLEEVDATADLRKLGIEQLIDWQAVEGEMHEIAGVLPLSIHKAAELRTDAGIGAGIDAVVIVDQPNFRGILRAIEPLAHRQVLILPLEPEWVVAAELPSYSALDAAWKTTSDTNYVARSGLKGHYLEFGTFWGSSFFPAFYRYHQWLAGKFFAFDSFAGLSQPLRQETEFSAGDFRPGTYCSNVRSFQALAEFVGMPAERCVVVPGFYRETLAGQAPEQYGLAPQSVSVCAIDCDLMEPTAQVLEFVTPLLEPGALLYFDDWRLCRASPVVGERAAALQWLKKHPDIELVELYRASWQHQWFIFQRNP